MHTIIGQMFTGHRLAATSTCRHIAQRFFAAQKASAIKSTASRETAASAENDPNKSSNEKLVKVAIVGVPNAGKSTFINNLINHRICPTSSKVHTTRGTHKAIHVRNNAQLILFDTPGLVSEAEMRKYRLESTFGSSPRHSIQHADLLGIVHDVSNTWTRGQLAASVLNTLQAYPKVPSFLILNKIDTLKSKRVLLDLARTLTQNTLVGRPGGVGMEKPDTKRRKKKLNDETVVEENDTKRTVVGWAGFSEVFMISSITGDGMAAVMKYLLVHTKTAAWEYAADEFTDMPPEQLIVGTVRARLLDFLPQEIPYQLGCAIEFYTHERGQIFASVQVSCPSERIERLMCGQQDGKLRQITERCTSDLIETFGVPISLTITTHSPKTSSSSSM